MSTAQLKTVAPAAAVARPTMAQRSAFKAAPAPSVARPSFARRVQKLQKAASVQARNVVVVRAANDKVRLGPRRAVCGARGTGAVQWARQPAAPWPSGSKAAPPARAAPPALPLPHRPAPALLLAGGGDRPGRRLRLRQVHLHAPVRADEDQSGRRRRCASPSGSCGALHTCTLLQACMLLAAAINGSHSPAQNHTHSNALIRRRRSIPCSPAA